MSTETIGADVLHGVREIAKFRGRPERETYRLLETGALPGAKLGGRWTASKSALREHWHSITTAQAVQARAA
jgi:hypothetical protein